MTKKLGDGFEDLELTADEAQLLAADGIKEELTTDPPAALMPGADPPERTAPSEPEPEKPKEPEKPAEPTPPATPAAAKPPAAPTPPEPEKPVTRAELEAMERQLQDQMRQNAGLRQELISDRERRRAAEQLARMPAPAATPPPTPPPAIELPPDVFDVDPQGRVLVSPAKLAEWQAKQTPPAAPTAPTAPSRSEPDPYGDPRLQSFQHFEARAISEAKDPVKVQAATRTLFEAAQELDRYLLAEGPKYQAQLASEPLGYARVTKLIELSGADKHIATKYPGADTLSLAYAVGSGDQGWMRATLARYLATNAPSETPAVPPPATPPAARPGQGDRPRPMASRGSADVETPAGSLSHFANLPAEQVFDLSDEDFKAMERAASNG